MEDTTLLYMENMSLYTCKAKVIDVLEENGRHVVLLDQTIFYPQGGGQPYDKGVINENSNTFMVDEVRFVDGLVKHMGTFEHEKFQKNQEVTCHIDVERRKLLNRIHSAGHVINLAITKLGFFWTTGKGFHFPEGPYVEYAGAPKDIDKEKLKIDIETRCNEYIAQNLPILTLFMDKEEMAKACHFVSNYVPKSKLTRIIMLGDICNPCGGTHVESLGEIKKITIRKIKSDGSAIHISYDVAR